MYAFIKNAINDVFDIIQLIFVRLFFIVDKCNLNRRFALWAGIILTIYTCLWCMQLVAHPPIQYSGVDVAAIIAAVLTPLSLLTGALMKFGEQYKGIKRASTAEHDKPED